MAGLRIVAFGAICVTILSTCVVCRPASDDATDFVIDDAPVAESGSGGAEKTLPSAIHPVMLAPGSGEEGTGAGSGDEDGEDDVASSGEELTSGSASGAPGIDVEIAPTGNKSTPGFTTLRKDIPSSTTARSDASSTSDLVGTSSTTDLSGASSTTGREVASSTTDREAASSTTIREAVSSTTVRSDAASTTDLAGGPSTIDIAGASSTTGRKAASSMTDREAASSTTDREAASSTPVRETTSSTTFRETVPSTTSLANASTTTDRSPPSTLRGTFINLEDESGSGVEDDPEPESTTEFPEDVVSGSGIGWPQEEPTDRLTSERPSDGLNATDIPTLSPELEINEGLELNTTDIPTLSPELEISEGLIPVTVAKTPVPTHVNRTMMISSMPTTTFHSTSKEATLPTSTTSLRIDENSGETTPESGSSTDLPVLDADKTTEGQAYSSTHAQNHTRHIEGRRRRPGHHSTTPEIGYEDVSVAEAKNEDDDGKKVSYFAVIAAALISAIVFFALGYLASIIKDKRRKLTLPWKKDRVTLEISTRDTGNGSATQVYRDTNPDRLTSVYDPVDSGSRRPKQNGSTERMPTNDLAEVHPKPTHLAEPDTDHVANEASPKISTPSEEVAPAPSSQNTADEMKYIDETDDDMEASAASTPLLPGQSQEEGERGDLATQVLSTVDKNLNTDSETKAPLLTDSTKDSASKSAGSQGNPPPV
ncbi:uncharacterized protein LOC135468031 [Liolophura sinensis]|uniref:uncharacterized protein LOC135468031 n=1 Tax=Liolophura sinensis TaxID=3198878 RepID=UPI0031599555